MWHGKSAFNTDRPKVPGLGVLFLGIMTTILPIVANPANGSDTLREGGISTEAEAPVSKPEQDKFRATRSVTLGSAPALAKLPTRGAQILAKDFRIVFRGEEGDRVAMDPFADQSFSVSSSLTVGPPASDMALTITARANEKSPVLRSASGASLPYTLFLRREGDACEGGLPLDLTHGAVKLRHEPDAKGTGTVAPIQLASLCVKVSPSDMNVVAGTYRGRVELEIERSLVESK